MSSPPLTTLLSQVLVAFTIEFDNEAEQRIPHWITDGHVTRKFTGVWLTSMVMYLNCMRFVGAEPIAVRRVMELARTGTNWKGMLRWGYIKIEPDPLDIRPKTPFKDWLVRATRMGRAAQEVQRPLFAEIEQRWRERFGADVIDSLRASLADVARQFTYELPDCMPILHYGLFCKGGHFKKRDAEAADDTAGLYFPSLLSRVLLALALSFERKSDVSLAIHANVLRVLGDEPVRVRDLSVLSGVSKESISMALGIIEKRGLAVAAPDPNGGRGKSVYLTEAGKKAQSEYWKLLSEVESHWATRFGSDSIARLRALLQRLASGEPSPLFQCLKPYPNGWRAALRAPKTLPHFPMVLHRGGYPDGS